MSGTIPYCVGEWLPSDQAALDASVKAFIDQVESDKVDRLLHPAVQELKELIENDPEVYMFFTQMFRQDPVRGGDPIPPSVVRLKDYQQMLKVINVIMTKAPTFTNKVPINHILYWPMATHGGFAAFLNDKVNRCFKKILNEWGTYLKSEDSLYVLNHGADGWLGPVAQAAMPNFKADFKCDPVHDPEHWGFKSWDDFFTRQFRIGRRRIARINDNSVIVNACESSPYKLAKGVKRRDTFWIKAQPYSMEHMLANDPLVDQFVGGTVYQAFLSSLSYHRWHSPVDGTVVKTRLEDGTYYSETLAEGFDPSGPNNSQAYDAQVGARAIIFIQADNPDIGLMCFLGVGMAEISSCEITVYEGQHIEKGHQLGMFHFGGSSHCLIFRPEVQLTFNVIIPQPDVYVHVNSRLATVNQQ